MFGIDRRAAKFTFTAALVLLLLYIVFVVRGTLFVLTVSLMFAYLLYPLVDLVARYTPSRSRIPALVAIYLALIGLLVTIGVTIGSRAAAEATLLSQTAPALIERMRTAVPDPSTPGQIITIKETALNAIHDYLSKHNNEIVSFIPGFSFQVLKASGNLIYLVIIPIISFFILKDGREIRDDFLDMVEPGPSRVFIDELLADIHTLLLQFMRALFTLCAVTLITFAIVLNLMGVPYAILLASLAFPLEFIPMIGPLIAAVVILSVSIFTGYVHLLWLLLFLGGYRLIQDYVVSPRLMSAGIELHPLLVIVGVFAGEEIGGVQGAFLSVPIIALLRVVYRRVHLSRISSTATVTA